MFMVVNLILKLTGSKAIIHVPIRANVQNTQILWLREITHDHRLNHMNPFVFNSIIEK